MKDSASTDEQTLGQPDPATRPPQTEIAASQAEPGDAEAADLARASFKLRGSPVAPGLVLGVVHRKDHDLTGSWERVPRGGIEEELTRFRTARDRAFAQLQDLKGRVAGRVGADDARILDTHLTYLRDSAFISDVENLITGEQMRLEAAIAKVIGDFDRIFRLVESQTLRQSAVDLRDVGIRVLRNLEDDAPPAAAAPNGDYVLVARELNIVDMFNLDNDHVRGIATEEGGLTSHAAIFARSMRIPTITAVGGLLEEVREGDFVLLDATEGTLHLNPDERVRLFLEAERYTMEESLPVLPIFTYVQFYLADSSLEGLSVHPRKQQYLFELFVDRGGDE